MDLAEAREKLETFDPNNDTDCFIKGLDILRKYCPHLVPSAKRGTIYIHVYFDERSETLEKMLDKITPEDFNTLGQMDWRIHTVKRCWYVGT